jgi:hypothetical protein
MGSLDVFVSAVPRRAAFLTRRHCADSYPFRCSHSSKDLACSGVVGFYTGVEKPLSLFSF